MDYIITADNLAGAVDSRAPNEHDAYSLGRQFERDGSSNVQIKTPDGDVYGVREFYQQVIMRGGARA